MNATYRLFLKTVFTLFIPYCGLLRIIVVGRLFERLSLCFAFVFVFVFVFSVSFSVSLMLAYLPYLVLSSSRRMVCFNLRCLVYLSSSS